MDEELFVIEGPRKAREGESITYSVTWTNATTLASNTTKNYLNGTLSTAVLSGSEAVSGNVQTLRTITIPTGWGGKTCVLEAWCTVDGNVLSIGIPIKILKAGAER